MNFREKLNKFYKESIHKEGLQKGDRVKIVKGQFKDKRGVVDAMSSNDVIVELDNGEYWKTNIDNVQKESLHKEAQFKTKDGKFKVGDNVKCPTGKVGKIVNITDDFIKVRDDKGQVKMYDEDELIKV